MTGSDTQRSRSREQVLVLDAAAFFARCQLAAYLHRIYTTPRVIEEVRDEYSRLGLEISSEIARIEIVEPRPRFIEDARSIARSLGILEKLSETDIEVIALALQLRSEGLEPVVVTDDYSIQNVLMEAGIRFVTVKTRGIERVKRFRRRFYGA